MWLPIGFLAPTLGLLFTFDVYPLFLGGWISLWRWGIRAEKFVGLDNYHRIIEGLGGRPVGGRPPWKVFPDRDDVPIARSEASTSSTDSPRVAASRAHPAPVTPPPITSTSTGAAPSSPASAADRWAGDKLLGSDAAGAGSVIRDLQKPRLPPITAARGQSGEPE